jgi:hypothetical protein
VQPPTAQLLTHLYQSGFADRRQEPGETRPGPAARGAGAEGEPQERELDVLSLATSPFAAGLIDEVRIDVVPVVFGASVRFFVDFSGSVLENPDIVQGDRVTYLHYRL